MILSKTLALFDNAKYIGPYMIFSDGEWLWPSYFAYYVNKEKQINTDFLNYLRFREYSIPAFTDVDRRRVRTFLEIEMLR